MFFGRQVTPAAGRCRAARQRRRRRRLPARRPDRRHRWPAASSGFTDMQRIVSGSAGRTLTITVDRGGAREDLKATPQTRAASAMRVLGISKLPTDDLKLKSESPGTALALGVEETYFVVERSLCFVAGVMVGRESADQLGGPIRIAEVSGERGSPDWTAAVSAPRSLRCSISPASCRSRSVCSICSRFRCSMAVTFCSMRIEALRGRPLSERAQEVGFRIGLAIVVMLMIFATYNDISGILHRSGRPDKGVADWQRSGDKGENGANELVCMRPLKPGRSGVLHGSGIASLARWPKRGKGRVANEVGCAVRSGAGRRRPCPRRGSF